MKKALLVFLVSVLGLGAAALPGDSKVRAYYSGDAIAYRDVVVTATANSDRLEIFKLEGDQLVRFVDVRPFDARFNKDDNFYDVKLSEENGRLYAYAISGFSLYKYDITSLNSADLTKKMTNTYWEWYNRVDKFGDNIVTISARGVKIYNQNMDVIDSYDITNSVPYNIRSNDTGRYIFNIKNTEIEVFDRTTRSVVRSLQVNYRSGNGNRNLYFDALDEAVYVVDDLSAKKIDFNSGAILGRFEHSGNPGYDAVSTGNDYLYFSNGLGVVKLNKNGMKLVSSQKTGGIAGTEGWAMGMKAVTTSSGEKLVVFNNSSVLVLDSSLRKLASFRGQEDTRVDVKENLYLRVNTVAAPTNAEILLSGGGYLPNEKLTVLFGQSATYTINADANGRFKQEITVPGVSTEAWTNAVSIAQSQASNPSVAVAHERVDIKVVGEKSKLTYSTAFEITTTN
ncbi:MAG TPA: hypothetical protein PKI61_03505 [bacterium]|nr:hypothetical protein [bacterium]HPT29583.1 hypothetical protein [bacterium]